MRRTFPYYLVVLGIVAIVVVACGSPAPTPTATPVPNALPTAIQVPVPTATPQPPKSDQVAAGGQRFASSCSCHAGGFSATNLDAYKTAAILYDYIKARMPPGNPSLISDQGRFDIVAYLLVTSGLIPATQVVNPDTLPKIVWAQPTAPAGQTQVASGETTFGVSCARCHTTGFSDSALRRYRTAAGLFQFIHSSMPPGNPQLISETKAYDIVAYLLTKAGLIKTDQPVNADTASNLSFE